MTDNRTTEHLMAMLEERGVEYKTHGIIGGKAVTWHGSVCNWVALPDERGLAVAVYKDYLTPEQAIAATLESDNEYERKMDTLLCRLTNGKWSKSRAYSIEFMVSCVDEEFEALYSEEQFSAPVHGTLTAEQVQKVIYKHGINDGFVYSVIKCSFQAIADELNAELGSGTCNLIEDGDLLHCSNCGGAAAKQSWAYWAYCPNCGAKVVKR